MLWPIFFRLKGNGSSVTMTDAPQNYWPMLLPIFLPPDELNFAFIWTRKRVSCLASDMILTGFPNGWLRPTCWLLGVFPAVSGSLAVIYTDERLVTAATNALPNGVVVIGQST